MSLLHRQRELQSHVLHGEYAIESNIVSDALPVATRLSVYSDAYRLRLIEALEGNYPILAELLGTETFATLATQYLDAHPSQHYSIRWFGHRFAEFLNATQSHQPGLAELAAWEWATAHAFDAADAACLMQADVAALAPAAWGALQLRTHPSLTKLQVHSNIVDIVKASADNAPLPTPSVADATEWCIWRQNLNVRYRSLDVIEARAIDRALHGATFGEVCEHLAEFIPPDHVPLRAAGFLKQWLEENWLRTG